MDSDQRSWWDAARGWDAYVAGIEQKRDVWEANLRRTRIDPAEAARLASLPGRRQVLVLTEDWCGDAARSIPALAVALEQAPHVEARYLDSDAHPDALDRYLTHGGRAIPIAVVFDEHGAELGAWGPRPAPLQALLREQIRTQGRPDADGMAAFYAPIMAWYGHDRGRTALQELLMLLERGGVAR